MWRDEGALHVAGQLSGAQVAYQVQGPGLSVESELEGTSVVISPGGLLDIRNLTLGPPSDRASPRVAG